VISRARARGTFAGASVSVLGVVTMLVASSSACNSSFRFDDATLPGADVDAGGDEPSVTTDASPSASACTTDTTCSGLRCDLGSGACVSCLADDDCAGGARPHCDPASRLCVECNAATDCTPRETCSVTTHRCIDMCTDGDDPCPGSGSGFVCDVTLHLCVECRTSANCAGAPNGPICDVPIGRCVQCTGNAQCPASSPVCDRRSGRCVGCLTSAACSAGTVCDKTALTCR
jgi:Cys-rich repeat protein